MILEAKDIAPWQIMVFELYHLSFMHITERKKLAKDKRQVFELARWVPQLLC